MKKLIDVGGIKDSLLPELLSGVDGGTDDSYLKAYEVIDRIENIVNEWIDNQIIVEVIPIEWIKEYVDFGVSDELAQRYRRFVLNMIKDWNKRDCPTIKAIPIEWIKKWKEKAADGSLCRSPLDLFDHYEYEAAINRLLSDWEKENEQWH